MLDVRAVAAGDDQGVLCAQADAGEVDGIKAAESALDRSFKRAANRHEAHGRLELCRRCAAFRDRPAEAKPENAS